MSAPESASNLSSFEQPLPERARTGPASKVHLGAEVPNGSEDRHSAPERLNRAPFPMPPQALSTGQRGRLGWGHFGAHVLKVPDGGFQGLLMALTDLAFLHVAVGASEEEGIVSQEPSLNLRVLVPEEHDPRPHDHRQHSHGPRASLGDGGHSMPWPT
eukprot:10259413-Alexandrium_andersonii.AAC.1